MKKLSHDPGHRTAYSNFVIVSEHGELLNQHRNCIVGPKGKYLIKPVFDKEELIVTELDFDTIVKERMTRYVFI